MSKGLVTISCVVALVLAAVIGTGVYLSRSSSAPGQTEAAEETRPPPPPAPEPEPEPKVEAAVTVDSRATQVAMEVLADGGTAADAAVAVAAVLSVIEPRYSNVISGESAALYYDAESGEIQSLEAVGAVGSDFDVSNYRNRGAGGFGPYQTLVPGAWGGWIALLQEYGELGLDRILAPAIELARDGHAVTAATARQAVTSLQQGAMNAPAQQIFAPGGQVVAAGQTVIQSNLANSLQGIVDEFNAATDREAGLQEAHDHVYTGDLGQRILQAIRNDGGYVTADDMANYQAELKDPISIEFNGSTVFQNPPTSQGITMLLALNTLRTAGLTVENMNSGDTAQLIIESLKLAMADREAHIGDPDFNDVPVDELLDPGYGEQQLARIDLNASASWPIASGVDGDTTTFQITDSDGNAIAVTTSTGYQFVAAGDTGIMLSNRMRYMTASDPQSPNFLEPGKQVRYTGNPYLIMQDDELRYLGGAIGGDTQSQIQAQHVLNVLSFGMTPAEAISRHRYVTQMQPNSVVPHGVPNSVRVEASTPNDIINSLRGRGQNVELTSGVGPFGYASMIEITENGTNASIGVETRIDTSTGDVRPVQ